MNIRKILSPAKINLALQVLFKRFDGYHNINTIFFKIPLYDELTFEVSSSTKVISHPDLNIPMEENLIFRAIDKVRKKFKLNKNVSVILNKKIPMGGGLGGGSSNAASTLLFLKKFWDLNINDDELIEIGLELGSDVPFFLTPFNAAIGKGRGEILSEIPIKLNHDLLIITSNIYVSTKEAYSSLDLKYEINEIDFKELFEANNPIKQIFFNDFEKIIFKKHPELAEIKNLMYKNKAAYSGMSGSGSTMFGLFKSQHDIDTTSSCLVDLMTKYQGLSLNSYTFKA